MAKVITLHEQGDTRIKLQKKMQKADIVVEVSTEFDPDLVPDTGIGFLDHLIARLSWEALHVDRLYGDRRPLALLASRDVVYEKLESGVPGA